MCKKYVKIEKAAFSNCSYDYSGTIYMGSGRPPKVASKEGVLIGDHYEYFDTKIVGEVDWIHLSIRTYSPKKKSESCSLCLKDTTWGSLIIAKGCIHKYHVYCMSVVIT